MMLFELMIYLFTWHSSNSLKELIVVVVVFIVEIHCFPVLYLEQKSSGTGNLSLLPSTFTDIQHKLRLWLEHVEQSLLNDKVRIVDIHAINAKKKAYKDLLDQTFEQEHNLESLNEIVREYYSKLTADVSRRLQGELTNYQERLYDVKMFLSERLAKYNRLDKTLSDFEVRFFSKDFILFKNFIFIEWSRRS
jgi:hypothetical protein